MIQECINNKLAEHPGVIKETLETYLKLSPEQREHAGSIHKPRCSGHCLNLTTGDSWKKPEKPTVESNMVVGRAALVIKRNLLIRLQRRVEGCYYAPNDKGVLCPFALESGS